jgi:hypothetical protein
VLERLEIFDKAEVNEDHLEILIGLSTSIEDKELTIDEAFVPYKKEAQERKSESVASGVKSMMGTKKEDASKLTPEEQQEYNAKIDKNGQTSM